MPFHVEISAAMRHARAFNLSAEELRRGFVEPWLLGRAIELGERDWEPRESSLKILEGPKLETPDLSFGQAWSNAERSAENVTKRVLEEAPPPHVPDAFVVESDLPEATVAEMLTGHAPQPVAWNEAWARIDGRDPRVAAMILVVKPPEAEPPRS
jgi:hypothetical protein